MRIFVSGPYSAPTEQQRVENMQVAAGIGAQIMQRGHTPFVPHLNHIVDAEARKFGIEFSWEDWMEYCKIWLRQCDALFSFGSSKGADIEMALAKEFQMPIFNDLGQLPKKPFSMQGKKAPPFRDGDELPLRKEGRRASPGEPMRRRRLRPW